MVKLKAYSTIEALISSVLILTVLSIGIIIMLNVMTSNKSALSHRAKQKLIELGLSDDLSQMPYRHDLYTIEMEIQNYKSIEDLKQVNLIAFDRQGILIDKLSFIRKKEE